MSHTNEYDVIVIGGGAIGLAAAYSCAKKGKKTLVLEAANFFNQSGSSGDLMRMFRTLYTQFDLAQLSYVALGEWKALETQSKKTLLFDTGQLNYGDKEFGEGAQGELNKPLENLQKLSKRVTTRKMSEVEELYKLRNLKDLIPENRFLAYESPDCAAINVPETLHALYDGAHGAGAVLTSDAVVTNVELEADKVTVMARIENHLTRITGDKVVIAAGPYTNDILGYLGLKLDYDIWELAYEYYATDPREASKQHFPGMWVQFAKSAEDDPSNLYYGFPVAPWGPANMVRIGWEDATVNNLTLQQLKIRRKHSVGLVPPLQDIGYSTNFVKKHTRHVDPYPAHTGVCLHTALSDHMSVLDVLPKRACGENDDVPGRDRAVLCTGGWAFKFLPVFGSIVSELATTGATKHANLITRLKADRPKPDKACGGYYLHKK